jgi:hypothetical protein
MTNVSPISRLVTRNQPGCAATDVHSLFAAYSEAKDVWDRTKIEANRQRAMRAYNAWITNSFPRDQQEALLLRSTSNWGFN